MMFMVGIELTKFVKDVRIGKEMIPLGVTLIISVATNMAYGFLAGLAIHYLMRRVFRDSSGHDQAIHG
jgi:hypothetical protein